MTLHQAATTVFIKLRRCIVFRSFNRLSRFTAPKWASLTKALEGTDNKGPIRGLLEENHSQMPVPSLLFWLPWLQWLAWILLLQTVEGGCSPNCVLWTMSSILCLPTLPYRFCISSSVLCLWPDWTNLSKRGGMDRVFQGLAGLLQGISREKWRGKALPAEGKPCPTRLFYSD